MTPTPPPPADAVRRLTPRAAAEAIEQFGDDLVKLISAFDRLCARMPSGFTDIINTIPHQDHLDDIAAAFRDRGNTLCGDCEAAEEADDYRRSNPLEPDYRRLGR